MAPRVKILRLPREDSERTKAPAQDDRPIRTLFQLHDSWPSEGRISQDWSGL